MGNRLENTSGNTTNRDTSVIATLKFFRPQDLPDFASRIDLWIMVDGEYAVYITKDGECGRPNFPQWHDWEEWGEMTYYELPEYLQEKVWEALLI